MFTQSTGGSKTPNLHKIIELAEERCLETKQLKKQPAGTPDFKRKLLQLHVCIRRNDVLAFIAATVFRGRHARLATEGVLPLSRVYKQYENLPKDQLIKLIMTQKKLPAYLKAGLMVLEQEDGSTPQDPDGEEA